MTVYAWTDGSALDYLEDPRGDYTSEEANAARKNSALAYLRDRLDGYSFEEANASSADENGV